MKQVIHIGNRPIVLISQDFDDEVDVDALTQIDYGNIYGDAVTCPALLNKVGMLRAEAENILSSVKIETEIYSSEFIRGLRVEAGKNGGRLTIENGSDKPTTIKATEDAYKDSLHLDRHWQELKNKEFKAKRDFEFLDSLFWAVQDKSKKLNNILPQVTPEEFVNELTEGKVNGMLIKKPE